MDAGIERTATRIGAGLVLVWGLVGMGGTPPPSAPAPVPLPGPEQALYPILLYQCVASRQRDALDAARTILELQQTIDALRAEIEAKPKASP